MTDRNPVFDVAKGIAVLLMIQVHIVELFAENSIFQSPTGRLSLALGSVPVAPVFLFTMGYFLEVSKKSPRDLIVRGWKLFFSGIILNIGLNAHLLIKIGRQEINANPWEYIFGIDILISAGIIVIVLAMMKKIFPHNLHIFILMCLISPLAASFLPEWKPENPAAIFLYALFRGTLKWSYFPIFPWLSYSLAGFTFSLLQKKAVFRKSGVFILNTLSLCIIICTFSFGFNISTDLEKYYHHGIAYFSWSMLAMMLWFSFLSWIEKGFSQSPILKYFKWVGRNVTGFYIIQWLIIGNTATAIFRSLALKFVVLSYPLILILTSFLVYILEKIRTGRRKVSHSS